MQIKLFRNSVEQQDHIHFWYIIIILAINYIDNVVSLNDSKDLLLTSAEKNALDKFKLKVKDSLPEDFMKTDFYLIRWLRENNLDISASETKLQETVTWRLRNNITKLLDEDWSDMEQDFPAYLGTHDKNGRPILDMFFGPWDVRGGVLQGKSRRLTLYLFYLLERSMRNVLLSQEKGKQVTKFLYIADVDGFSLVQHVCPLCVPIMVQYALSLARYPGFIADIIVVNAPPTVQVPLNIARPLMPPDLRSRIKVFGTNRSSWQAYLKRIIDDDQLPSRLGGTKSLGFHEGEG